MINDSAQLKDSFSIERDNGVEITHPELINNLNLTAEKYKDKPEYVAVEQKICEKMQEIYSIINDGMFQNTSFNFFMSRLRNFLDFGLASPLTGDEFEWDENNHNIRYQSVIREFDETSNTYKFYETAAKIRQKDGRSYLLDTDRVEIAFPYFPRYPEIIEE